MDYIKLVNRAIREKEVIQLLRGEKEYEVEVSQYISDVFPTDINAVLVNCFYKQKESVGNIDNIFYAAFDELLCGTASDVYIAVLYFDACIFHEERNKATFLLDKERLVPKMMESIKVKKEDLQGEIIFCNGLKKQNPWKNIENFNKYYSKKYGFSIIL